MKHLRGKSLYLKLLAEQREWIKRCEAGTSYLDGLRGQAIRQADQVELHRIETWLRESARSYSDNETLDNLGVPALAR